MIHTFYDNPRSKTNYWNPKHQFVNQFEEDNSDASIGAHLANLESGESMSP
jgi:hypothetical protein